MATEQDVVLQEWDVEKLRKELEKSREARDDLLQRTSQLQHSVAYVERLLQGVPNEDTVWCERYMQQHSLNQQLQSQFSQLERRLTELQRENKAVGDQGGRHDHAYDDMSDVGMRQLLCRLEKEKTELEWQLKDCEWRLDQEAAAVHRAVEEKNTILTALGQASLELEKCKQKKDAP